MKNTDTPRTDASIWKLTKFDSALLEHDGETLNEIHCASHDEAECLVDLLNRKSEELAVSQAEVERLKNGFQGSCYCCEPVGEMNQKLQAEVEKLKTEQWFTEETMSKEIATLKEALEELSESNIVLLCDVREYRKRAETLRPLLNRAVIIAEMFQQVKALHHHCNCAMCQKLAELKEEIK